MDYDKIDWKKPQPAPRLMKAVFHLTFPEITYFGIYQDRNVSGTNKKSSHAEGRALDFHLSAFDSKQAILGYLLSRMLVRKAKDFGIDNVIWNRQIWSMEHQRWRPYTGDKPHEDHVHVEFTREGSQVSPISELVPECVLIRKIADLIQLEKSYSI